MDTKTNELLEKINALSEIEMNEIEIMNGIFQKKISKIVDNHLSSLSNEFESSYKEPDKKLEIKEEIINGYKGQFNRIQECLEAQYMNLFYELKEIQSSQKIAIVKYKKKLEKEDISEQDCDIMTQMINKYRNYCGLEDKCYEMINNCENDFEQLLNTVMQYDKKEMIVKKNVSIFEKIRNLLKKNKYEDKFLLSKRERIKKISKDIDTLEAYIRNKTIKDISTLAIYKKNIKEKSSKVI